MVKKTVPCDKFIDEGECECPTLHYLAPGSRDARGHGCTCAVMDNEYGRGYHHVKGMPRMYVMNKECPVHDELFDEEEKVESKVEDGPSSDAGCIEVTDHFDGLGLNDTIKIIGWDFEYGAAHKFGFYIGDKCVGWLQFQQGPRLDPKSIPGITEAALLAVVAERVRGFQSGPFPSRENALVLTKTEEAIHWTRHRAEERKRRGVLGKAEK